MPEPRKSTGATAAKLVFAAVVVTVAFFAPQLYGDPAPFGEPLPPVSHAFKTEGVKPGDTSFNQGRVPAEWLEFLAPQPDGSPPLRYKFDASGAEFEIWHPLGVEAVVLPPEQQQATSALAIAGVELDQPLMAIKYSLPPRREGETIEEYVARVQQDLERKGAEFYGEPGEYRVTGYKFQTLVYSREAEEYGLLYHYLFIGPYGPNALVIDFSARPEDKDSVKPYVEKIIGSFKPKDELKRLYQQELDGPPALDPE